jgi:hypothetical protein
VPTIRLLKAKDSFAGDANHGFFLVTLWLENHFVVSVATMFARLKNSLSSGLDWESRSIIGFVLID